MMNDNDDNKWKITKSYYIQWETVYIYIKDPLYNYVA